MSAFRDVFLAAAVLFFGALPAAAQDLTGAVWSVCGYDGAYTWHDTRLVFLDQSATETGMGLSGYFDWRSSGGHTGREWFHGTLDADGSLALQGVEISGGASIVTSRYLAQVNDEGTAIVDGVWLDGAPGIWAALRDGGQGTAERLCGTEAQVS
ncbi:hypothetical protein [Hasllibacter sp. MH4015]|uniref:hypothetical protein n=1 Tax=Hasllibacter sp. MH4015 TaxID=2854029 RepID=UPI001CD6600B|nr:hypothetical protein [Hasllibacter sp. MH4015]